MVVLLRQETIPNCWPTAGTTRPSSHGRREAFSERRAAQLSLESSVLVQGSERGHVGKPEPCQPALLVHLDVKIVGCANTLHRASRTDLKMKDALERIRLNRQARIHLD